MENGPQIKDFTYCSISRLVDDGEDIKAYEN